MPTRRYETEVDLITEDGREVTYSGEGVGPDDESGEQLLNGVEAAALAQEPGAVVTGSRVR